MPKQSETLWIQDFKGRSDTVIPGSSPILTPDLLNVKARYGNIIGRGGMTKYLANATPAPDTPIIDLMSYRRVSGTHELLRMTPLRVEKLNTGTSLWDNITGTALTGSSTLRPQSTLLDDILFFTNEGIDRPREYIGSGNTVVIGGTPPYCKAIKAYEGFLFFGNVSNNGTFTDVVDGYRTLIYRDDPETNDTCEGTTIVLDETPGYVTCMEEYGRVLYCGKNDGIVAVTFTGGVTRFKQDKLPSEVGVLAPLTFKKIEEVGILFLGPGALIYKISANGQVVAVAEAQLRDTLPPKLSLQRFRYARALVDSEADTYWLFYDRTGLSGQLLDSFIAYNYRSDEVTNGELGKQVIASVEHKTADDKTALPLIASSTLVYNWDIESGIDDDGTAVNRYWTSGWQSLHEEGWLFALRMLFKKDARARVKVSVALDFEEDFQFEQTFSLTGGAAGDTRIEVIARFGSPQWCSWANVKIKYVHATGMTETRLQRLGFELSPRLKTSERTIREGEATTL
jgi:hypothetical protein